MCPKNQQHRQLAVKIESKRSVATRRGDFTKRANITLSRSTRERHQLRFEITSHAKLLLASQLRVKKISLITLTRRESREEEDKNFYIFFAIVSFVLLPLLATKI
jgi:hypothetical protein